MVTMGSWTWSCILPTPALPGQVPAVDGTFSRPLSPVSPSSRVLRANVTPPRRDRLPSGRPQPRRPAWCAVQTAGVCSNLPNGCLIFGGSQRCRDRNNPKTRSAIIDAAAAAFDEYGYQGPAESDPGPGQGDQGALYFHFSSRRNWHWNSSGPSSKHRKHLLDGTKDTGAHQPHLRDGVDLTTDVRVRARVGW
jgi:hypothetical protein